MRCSACNQEFQRVGTSGSCPLCGAPARAGSPRIAQLYLISGGLFASTLLYGAMVTVLMSTGYDRPAPPPILRHALLGATLMVWAAMRTVERSMLARKTVAGVTSACMAVGAMSETVAVFGLVLFFLGDGIKWFTVFLGLALVSFIYLATRMPTYARLLTEYDTADNAGDAG